MALNTFLSLCSVLDDEGSNLRQQKLDRQVSKAGLVGRQNLSRGPGAMSPFSLDDPVRWLEKQILSCISSVILC